jgi:hypothetical protein
MIERNCSLESCHVAVMVEDCNGERFRSVEGLTIAAMRFSSLSFAGIENECFACWSSVESDYRPHLENCMSFLIPIMTFAIAVSSIALQGPTQNLGWKTFKTRAGWSIQYAANWKVGSCEFCSDPREGNGYVTFRNPDRDADFVMVERLASKPVGETVERWLHKMSEGNSNPRISEETLLLDGMPALRVRNRHRLGWEFETVYVIRNADTFSIGISDDKAGERIQDMPMYPVYQHMLSTFRFTRK